MSAPALPASCERRREPADTTRAVSRSAIERALTRRDIPLREKTQWRLRAGPVIVRGLRTAADLRHEYQLAAMNEQLGIQTVWLPSRPQLAATSSTVERAYRSAQSAR